MTLDFDDELADATLIRFSISDQHGESFSLELRGGGIERFRKYCELAKSVTDSDDSTDALAAIRLVMRPDCLTTRVT